MAGLLRGRGSKIKKDLLLFHRSVEVDISRSIQSTSRPHDIRSISKPLSPLFRHLNLRPCSEISPHTSKALSSTATKYQSGIRLLRSTFLGRSLVSGLYGSQAAQLSGAFIQGIGRTQQSQAQLARLALAELRQSMAVAGRGLGCARDEATQRARQMLTRLKWAYWEGTSSLPYLSPLARTVGASSLAFSRSHILPRLLALFIGEATLKQSGLNERVAHAEQLYGQPHLSSQTVSFVNPLLGAVQSLLEGFILLFRAIHLFLLFAPVVISGPVADMGGPEYRAAWLRLVHRTLERAGAAFIKWGQWAATRPDLFPKDLCAELSKLHTKAPAHPFHVTKSTVERAFRRPLDDIFEEFDTEPVASGSIAQVHRALLKHRYPRQRASDAEEQPQGREVGQEGAGGTQALASLVSSSSSSERNAAALKEMGRWQREKEDYVEGEEERKWVAVKVRHPGVGQIIHRDFVIMHLVAQASSLLPGLKGFRLEESVQQFAVFMMGQVDLAREAAHLSRFNYNFRRWKDISFPRPVYPLVHPEVLVESFENGESVARYVDRSKRDYLNSDLAKLGSRSLLKMLLEDNFIHADLHPGNILVRVQSQLSTEGGAPSPKELLRPHAHICLLDVGMTAELQPKYRSNMLEFFKAVAVRNGRKAAECTLRFTEKQSCPNPEAFIQGVDESFKAWDATGLKVPTGDCMQELLEQIRRHRVNIDGDVCTVIITTLVLEGWQRKLDPSLSVMDTLNKILFQSELASSLAYTMECLVGP